MVGNVPWEIDELPLGELIHVVRLTPASFHSTKYKLRGMGYFKKRKVSLIARHNRFDNRDLEGG